MKMEIFDKKSKKIEKGTLIKVGKKDKKKKEKKKNLSS